MQTNHVSTYSTIINAPVNQVWEAIINPDKVRQYFFGTNLETSWKVGSSIAFSGEFDGQSYQDKGEVLEFKPEKRLSYTYLSSWANLPDKPENYLHISYDLEPVEKGTKLTITQSNYDEERAKHSEGNWKAVIDGMKKLLKG